VVGNFAAIGVDAEVGSLGSVSPQSLAVRRATHVESMEEIVSSISRRVSAEKTLEIEKF